MSGEKTEQPTAKKLRDARKKGEVPKSRELVSAATLLAVSGALIVLASGLVERFASIFVLVADAAAEPTQGATRTLGVAQTSVGIAAIGVLPILIAAAAIGALVTFLQVGPLLSLDAVAFKPERVDPIKGAKNLLTTKRAVELLKTLTLFLGVAGIVAYTLHDGTRGVLALSGRVGGVQASLSGLGALGKLLMLRVGSALLAVGLIDLLYQRWQFLRDQRMSKDEVKREHKDAEGDAHQKQERQRAHQEVLEHQTLEQVRSADVLVVNPTHLAIALGYDADGEGAPEVLAKGADHLAQRMIRAAREAGVPVLRDVPLARSLYTLETHSEVPEGLYDAVAAVLLAAWKERQAEDGAPGESDTGDEVVTEERPPDAPPPRGPGVLRG